ncbi:MAG: thioesterase family protein [Actinobacteria bacterium]|nr:thioesterase family protein [Actinomycetota bacterium]
MSNPRSLTELLSLERLGGEDRFRQGSLPNTEGRSYGGQLLAQSVVAAQQTSDSDRAVHSLHGYFLSPGNLERPLEYRVERLRDGRSFSSRRVDAWQGDRLVFTATVSFHVPEHGVEHQIDLPAGIPGPEELADHSPFAEPGDGPPNFENMMEAREVPPELWPGDDSFHAAAWLRIREPLRDDPRLHQAAVAYLSDAVLQFPVLYSNGVSWSTPDAVLASLDHGLWWHGACRADDWLLVTHRSPNSRGGRGISMGCIYDRAGRMVASNVQEMLLRL